MSNGSDRNGGNIRGPGDEVASSGYKAAGALAAGALIGGIYWLAKGRKSETVPQKNTQAQATVRKQTVIKPNVQPVKPLDKPVKEESMSGYLIDLLSRMTTPSGDSSRGYSCEAKRFQRSPPPEEPCLTNLNALLSDIFVRYIQIKDSDFQLHYQVFDKIFLHLHQKMKEVDPYYKKYSSTVQFAGSHFDNLRIKKPDEFDMDIIIDLPLNLKENPTNPAESDIIIEAKSAGYAQLKMGIQFQKLPMRDGGEWQNNKAAYEWMDGTNYLLRSKFLDWFKSVVNKALNRFEFSDSLPLYYVNGVPYAIKKSESGPAMTLIIVNKSKGFRMDVDLVPALKFPESRWPIGPSYRRIPAACARGDWMLVGKSIRNGIPHDQDRSWRIALHNQERQLMYDTGNLRQAVRLLKKLRDTLGLKKIASYYVKTLFFWEIVERDKSFWQTNNPAFLFKLMVGKLHAALVSKKIPYFWNKNNNLIGCVDYRTLFEYAAKLVPLMQVLEHPEKFKQVARYLLTPEEFKQYNASFLHI